MHLIFRLLNLRFLFLFILIVIAFSYNVKAQTIVWGNSGASTAWYTAANWSPSTAFGAWTTSNLAQFQNTGSATTSGINMGTSNLSIGAIEVTSARTRGLTIGNSTTTAGTLTLNGISVNSVSNTILRNNSANDLTLQNNETGSGKTLNIAIANPTGNNVNIDGAGSIFISSNISGSSKLLIFNSSSTGDFVLSGTNTWSGGFTAAGASTGTGKLRFDATASFPTTGSIAVNTYGRLSFNVAGTFGNSGQTITFNPTQTVSGSLENNTSNISTVFSGAVVFSADTRIEPAGSTGQITLSGNATGSGTIVKQAAGILVFSGTSNNLTGGTQIGNGTLTINSGSSMGTGGLNMYQTSTNNTALNLNNSAQTISSLVSNFTATTGTQTQIITLGTGHTLTINQSTNTTYGKGTVATLSSKIAGAGNLVKSGTGILTLTSANTYTGTTTISNGKLDVGVASALASSTNITLDGGTLGTSTGFSQSVGTLNLNSNSTIALGSSSHNLNFAASNGVTWNGTTLTITGWTGTVGVTGTTGKIYVGTTSSGLLAGQLSKISFTGYAPGASILSTGEIVPTSASCTTPGTPSCSTPSTVCYPATATITGAGSSPAASTYTYWTASTGGSQITSGTSPAGTVSGNNLTSIASTAAGTYTYYVQGENSSCVSAARQAVTVTINDVPTQPSSISGSSLPCPSTSGLTYNVTNVAGVTYTWTVPTVNGWSITAGQNTNSITVSSGTGGGNITCTPSNNCGNGTAATPLAVNVSSTPNAPIFTATTSTNNVVAPCAGSTTRTYTVTNDASVTYSWSVPFGWSITAGSTTNSITVTIGANSGNVNCTATNACSGTANTNFAVAPVSGSPSTPVFTSSTTTNNVVSPCNSATGLTYTVNTISNATYTWTVPSGWSITSGQSTNSITVNCSSTSGNVRCTASNDCGNVFTDFAVTPVISSPSLPSFTSATSTNNVASPCASATSLTYTITAISGVTYSWSVPSGWVINSGQGTNSINVNSSATNGNITVTVTNACGSNNNSIAVTPVNGVPAQPGSISGTNPVCQSTASVAYTISSVASAASYTWSYSGTGATNSNTTTFASYTFSSSATSGNLSVIANNVCGSSTSQTLALTVNATPVFSLQPSSVNIAPGASTSFSATASNSPSYQWQYSSNGSSGWASVSSGTPTGATYTNDNTATMNVSTTGSTPISVYYYRVLATANGCSATSNSASMGLANYVSFDDFSRSNSNTVGIPSSVSASGGTTTWTENETTSQTARISIESQKLRLSSASNPTGGSGNSNGHEFLTYDVSSNYTTTITNAQNNLEWYFNMKSSRNLPSGFSTASTYGAAFILGSDNADLYTASTANGYAVVLGNSSTPDPVKLVAFTGGFSSNSNMTDIATSAETGETDYYSVHVTFNPCTNLWSLQVRSDGSSAFTNPTSGSYSATVTGTNSTHVAKNLKYLGAFWQHGSPASGSEDVWFDNFYIPTNIAAITTYTWNGSSTDYQVATAWTPSRTCPRVTDILQYNSATSPSTCTVTNIPTQTIGQFIVTGNRTVTLSDAIGDAAASTLTIGGNNSDDLQVTAGSTLNLDVASSNHAADAMIIQLSTGVTASISGNVVFKNSNSGTAGRPHQLLGTDASSINFNSGAIFTAMDLSGEAFGNTGTANTVIFKTGSTYVSQDGSAPFGLTQPSSKVVYNSGSLYRHEQSTAPTYVGRTYANFEYNYTGTVNNGLGSSSTNACNIDTLTVTQGTINFPLTTNNLPLHFIIKGDIKFNGGTFNFSPTSTTADIKIGGNVLQNVKSGSGAYTFGTNSTLEMSNANHLQLYRDLVLDGSLILTNGQIITGAYEVYEKNNSTSAISGHSAIHSISSNSYINGNLRRKVTTGSFQFPVGTSTKYELARIVINSNSDVDNLLANFNQFNGGCTYASNLPSFETTPSNGSHSAQITDMLNYGYFIVEPFDASKVLVSSPTINYDAEMSFNGHSNGVTLSIAPQCYALIKRNSACSGSWSLGGGTFVSTTQQGTSSSTNVVTAKLSGLTTFSQFNTGFSSSDVLPIELLYFTAEANGNEVILNWATAIEKSSDRFEMERSLDGVNFKSIASMKGQGDKNGTSYYHTTDNISTLNTLVVYYRLKQVDKNESYSYSEIKALTFQQQISNDIHIETVYPNPFIDNIAIEITLNKVSNVQYQIIDLFGRVLTQKDELLANGNHHLQINDLNKLPKGIYLIKINTDTYSKQLRIEKL